MEKFGSLDASIEKKGSPEHFMQVSFLHEKHLFVPSKRPFFPQIEHFPIANPALLHCECLAIIICDFHDLRLLKKWVKIVGRNARRAARQEEIPGLKCPQGRVKFGNLKREKMEVEKHMKKKVPAKNIQFSFKF